MACQNYSLRSSGNGFRCAEGRLKRSIMKRSTLNQSNPGDEVEFVLDWPPHAIY